MEGEMKGEGQKVGKREWMGVVPHPKQKSGCASASE